MESSPLAHRSPTGKISLPIGAPTGTAGYRYIRYTYLVPSRPYRYVDRFIHSMIRLIHIIGRPAVVACRLIADA